MGQAVQTNPLTLGYGFSNWSVVRLAEYLANEGYSDDVWSAICQLVDEGAYLDSLVALKLLALADLAGAQEALDRGRRRRVPWCSGCLAARPRDPGRGATRSPAAPTAAAGPGRPPAAPARR